MKDQADNRTADLLEPATEAPRRGRPKTPDSMSNAERARRYRENKKKRLALLRDTTKPPTSKILDLSGDLAEAIKNRGEK